MPRYLISTFCLLLALLSLACSDSLVGQVDGEGYGTSVARGPGFYIAWWKLLMCLPVFLFWVKAADWVNVDLHRTGPQTKLEIGTWNPIIAFSFLGGFVLLLCIPLFWIGFPLFLISGVLPYFLYVGQRNGKVAKHEKALLPIHRGTTKAVPVVLEQDKGISMEFSPGGEDSQRSQANLIAARQNPFFIQIKEVLNDIASKRSERVQLDYTQQAVAVRYEVDGVWIKMPPRDRQSGDSILYGLKQLANMNPQDRQTSQKGDFKFEIDGKKIQLMISSSGTQTGERVIMKVNELKKREVMSVLELGMLPEMLTTFRQFLNSPGYVVVSAMPGDGMSASWLGTLDAADRVTRDFVGVCDRGYQDKVIENVEFREFDKAAGASPLPELKNLAAKLPEAFVLPEANDSQSINYLCDQIEQEEVFVISQMGAKSAVEALVRMLMINPDRSKFAKSISCVLYHRLFRRLCDKCKQPVQPPPKLVQQLGLQPDPKMVFFQQYQQPTPEQLVDDKGRPIEPPPPCRTCGGIGYYGRIAVFELLNINDKIRQAIVNTPTVKDLTAVAKNTGHVDLASECVKLVPVGVTSIQEIQRVLKK